jgi:sulfatase maturation enzyme AslB (radical SAM superfamily)
MESVYTATRRRREEKKAVVLLSGGMDSATCAAMAVHQGYEVLALSILYGQKHHIELAAAEAIAPRLAGCNLRCPWCDTPQALSATGHRRMGLDPLIKQIEQAGQTGQSPSGRYVVLTGGEPGLQPESNRPEMAARIISWLKREPRWRMGIQLHKVIGVR